MRYGKKIKNILPLRKKFMQFFKNSKKCIKKGDIIKMDGGVDEWDKTEGYNILVVEVKLYHVFFILLKEETNIKLDHTYSLMYGHKSFFAKRTCPNLILSVKRTETKEKGREILKNLKK